MDAPLLLYSLSQLFFRALMTAEELRLPALWQEYTQPLRIGLDRNIILNIGVGYTRVTSLVFSQRPRLTGQ